MREGDPKLVKLIRQAVVESAYVPDEFDNFTDKLSQHLHEHMAFREALDAVKNAGMSENAQNEAKDLAKLSYKQAKEHWDAHPQHHADMGGSFGDVYDDVAQSHREIHTGEYKDHRGHYTHNGWKLESSPLADPG